MSSPFSNKRNSFGQGAVNMVCGFLNVRNIQCQLSTDYWGKEWTSFKDLIYGDIIFLNNWFDIKRNSISCNSLENFEGTGFLMFNVSLNKNIFIPRTLSQAILTKIMPVELDSGDLGYRFTQFESRPFVSIEHFIDNILTKYDKHDNIKKTESQIS
jgi:hypothetical protein